MNKLYKIAKLSGLIILTYGSLLYSSPFTPWQRLLKTDEKKESAPVNPLDRQIQTLEKEKSELGSQAERKAQAEKISTQIAILKEKLKTASTTEREFLNKKLSLLSQILQACNELQQAVQQVEGLIAQHQALLHEYKEDPEFKNLRIPVQASYSFDKLQELGQRLLDYKIKISDLEKNKLTSADDLAKRKKALAAIQEEYREKQKQQEEFGLRTSAEVTPAENGFSPAQRGELLDEHKRLLSYKKDLAELKVKESERKLALSDSQLEITKKQALGIRDDYARIKRSLHVDAQYVKKAETELESKRQGLATKLERLHERMKVLSPLKDDIKRQLDDAITRFGISMSDLTLLKEWSKEPRSISEWLAICTIGNLSAREALIDIEREYLEAQIDLEKAKFRLDELNVYVIRSWHKMTQKKFRADLDKEIDQEIKNYETPRAELQADLAVFTERRNSAINVLHSLNVLLDRVKSLSTLLKEHKNLEFKDHQDIFRACLQLLYESEEQIRKRIDYTAKLIELYSAIIATVNDSMKHIESVVAELGTKSFWRRSEQSIEWSEVRNFFPDLKRFFSDAHTAALSLFSVDSMQAAIGTLKKIAADRTMLFIVLLRLTMIIVIFMLIRAYLPDIISHLSSIPKEYGRISVISLAIAKFLDFIYYHLVIMYGWSVVYVLIKFGFIQNASVAIIFYLLSIPVMLALAYRLTRYFLVANERSGYVFISRSYEPRFVGVVSSLLYATICLFFLREAFLRGNYPYPASHVPTILLALSFIALQIALMSLIGKEQILRAIPTHTPMWEWIKDHVSKYYYLLWLCVIAIIVMSNPYVGYGHQVLYILSRVALTALLVPLFLWVHNRVKRISSDLFFYYSEGEAIKERFATGRTWYGLFVIASFLLFVLMAVLVIAQIWGYPVTLRDISEWLNYELYSPGFDEMGRRIWVTGLSLLKIVLFILSGIGLTYIINHFILKRIFDPLLVGSGVQNTIFTLTRYAIIVLSVLIGLQSAGLDAMTTKIAIVIGGLSVALREPIGDFLAYFIILVQRPIKIGDLVMIDENVTGVVRHITPRSVLLRRKNSVTIVVPNLQVITKPLINWNYSRSFFAFNDILITVPYSCDPARVRQLMLKVLELNSNVLKTPSPLVWLHDFTDNGFQFLVRGYLTADKVLDQWEISSEVRLEIVKTLRLQGMDIASPTRTVKIIPPAQPFHIRELQEFQPDTKE